MSFASDLKKELCAVDMANRPCCTISELYGALIFAHSFSKSLVKVYLENECVSLYLASLCQRLCGISLTPEHRGDVGMYILTIDNPKDLSRLFSVIIHSFSSVSLRIDNRIISDECCVSAFLRGAFLTCGQMTDPKKSYHFEFMTPHFNLSRDLLTCLSEIDLRPKSIIRKANYIVYFKDSGSIEDILTLMGATSAFFELADAKIYKDLRNTANRIANCETANIDKSTKVSARQIERIALLMKQSRFDSLSDELKDMARQRLMHPEASFADLGEMMTPSLSKSGVRYRLARLEEIYLEHKAGE